MAVNGFTVPPQVLQTLLESHRGMIDSYLWSQITERVAANTLTGTSASLPLSQGRVGMADPSRPAKMAPGAKTPKGHLEFASRPYRAEVYGFAESINHIDRRQVEEYTNSIDSILQDRALLNVLTAAELDLEQILLGDTTDTYGEGVTTITLSNAQRFDAYDPSSDVASTIRSMRDISHGDTLVLGSDVAEALTRHPQVTNGRTGNAGGVEVTSFGALIEWLQGRGISRVYIANHEYTNRARELGYNRTEFFQSVFALFRSGAIKRPSIDDVYYNSWYDDDTRTTYLGAYATHGYMTSHVEDVVVLKNILTP